MQYPEEKWVVPDGLSRRALSREGPGRQHEMRFVPALRICLPAQSHPITPPGPAVNADRPQRGKDAEGI